ncbi:Smr/MutS family protein [uncultured Sphingomonas sp.]|uniref:Smr/MutS family protein n=1 Tax=uncultured Sphingomonas sp. TaxID=158754 RepID=UPI0035CB66D9
MASVRPLRAVAPAAAQPIAPTAVPNTKVEPARGRVVAKPVVISPPAKAPRPGVTLDGGWDRRLLKGAVAPDNTIDLHGHTLASAHAMLDARLEDAVTRGDRVLLLVTGKPPRPESERPHARGAIRAAVADWLASSRHAGRIAAVRGAHPRHGGAGALYIILRRTRG